MKTNEQILRDALAEAVAHLARMDTIRHLDPSFPALDNARAALAATQTPQPDVSARKLAAEILALPRYADVVDLQGNFSLEYAPNHKHQLVYIDGIERLIKEFAAAPESAEPSAGALVPKEPGEFHSYQNWVNKAQSRLTSPSHKQAICVDAKNRRCFIGADFMRARDENAFPVRYFWDFEEVGIATSSAAKGASDGN